MNEASLSKKLIRRINDRGGWARKAPGGIHGAGWPDIVGVYDSIMLGLEVKLPGKEKNLTQLQAETLERMSKAGAVAKVVTSAAEVDEALYLAYTARRITLRATYSPSGCLEWQGKINNHGYGEIRFHGRKLLVHRVVALLYLGFELHSELKVLHSCDNRSCCEPTHLFIGTLSDNSRDMARKGRQGNQLPLITVSRIREMADDQATLNISDIAREFDVARRTVRRIIYYQRAGDQPVRKPRRPTGD